MSLTRTTVLPEAADWKDRYFQAMSSLNEKEKAWNDRQARLHKGLLRLAFNYYGQFPELDHELDALRDLVRKGRRDTSLQKALDDVVNTIVALDAKPPPAPEKAHTELLIQLLDSLRLPDGALHDAASLKSRLGARQAGANVESLVRDCAQLIEDHLGSQAPMCAPGDVDRAGVDAEQALLRVLDAVTPPPPYDEVIAALGRRLRMHREQSELLAVCDELAALLAQATQASPAAVHDCAETDDAAGVLGQALLQLLDRLNLPAEMTERASAVRMQLEAPTIDTSTAVNALGDLIGGLQRNLQREIEDMAEFLQQITERLQAFQQNLFQADTARADSLRESQRLDAVVRDHVQDIRASVAEADTIEQLKQSINSRLETIDNAMTSFAAAEALRSHDAECALTELKDRLLNLEEEAGTLRTAIREEHVRAMSDPLTGIPNRLAYDERIAQEVARWKRQQGRLALLILDIDRFKDINDACGHSAGDKVLKTIAELMCEQVRETDFVARFGGEEFVLLLPDTSLEAAMMVAEKLRRTIDTCNFHFHDNRVPVTVSCGLAEFEEGDTAESVFERADEALYVAKRDGRNRCHAVAELLAS